MPLPSAALWPVAAIVAALGGQQGTAPAGQTDVITIAADANQRMTVPVRIGERGPFRFLIDTGSQNTVLSTALARRLALSPSDKARLIGVAGTEQVDTVRIDQLDLGRRSYYALLAPLLEAANIGADGILGLDSLQGQRLLIDFKREVVAVDDARRLGGDRGYEIVVTARRRSGQLIMTEATIDGVQVSVVIDTGAENSIGNRALQRALSRRIGAGEQTVLRSVTGQEITADVAMARELTIDRMHFGNVFVSYADSPTFAALGLEKRPALLLGMRELRVLDRVAIDFAQRRIYFALPAGALGS